MAVRSKPKPAEAAVVEDDPEEISMERQAADSIQEAELEKPSGKVPSELLVAEDDSILDSLFTDVDSKLELANAKVESLEKALAKANRTVQLLTVLKQMSMGMLPSTFSPVEDVQKPARKASGGGSAPKPRAKAGSIAERILQALTPDGLTAGAILDACMVTEDDKPKYRAQLFQMKKKGSIGYIEEGRLYTKI